MALEPYPKVPSAKAPIIKIIFQFKLEVFNKVSKDTCIPHHYSLLSLNYF